MFSPELRTGISFQSRRQGRGHEHIFIAEWKQGHAERVGRVTGAPGSSLRWRRCSPVRRGWCWFRTRLRAPQVRGTTTSVPRLTRGVAAVVVAFDGPAVPPGEPWSRETHHWRCSGASRYLHGTPRQVAVVVFFWRSGAACVARCNAAVWCVARGVSLPDVGQAYRPVDAGVVARRVARGASVVVAASAFTRSALLSKETAALLPASVSARRVVSRAVRGECRHRPRGGRARGPTVASGAVGGLASGRTSR